MERLYKFDNIVNFRDFGGYATHDGRQLKPAKLFRSANFHRSNPTDLSRLAQLDIRLLVDLRYAPERAKQPNKWPDKSQTRVLPFEDIGGLRDPDIAPHEAFTKNDLREAEDARNYMIKSYTARPSDPGFVSIFSQTLKHMAETGDNIVIHCAAGKDRTGTLAAIIHSALGVDSETIMQDYMLTMKAVDIESFLKPAAQMMAQRYNRDYSLESLRPMFGVEPSYLESSLGAIGDMQAYIRDELEISEAELRALRAQYLSA